MISVHLMSEVEAKIETILFLSARPVSFKKLAKLIALSVVEVEEAVASLAEARNKEDSGIHVIVAERAVELGSNPAFGELVSSLTKEEVDSELTRPQLEALTIIAYRGPITKPEIEHIRGVNCTIIVRNLLMRGLIIEKDDQNRLQPVYTISSEMMRHLGIHQPKELPDYDTLHSNAKINQMLESLFHEEDVT
jgi:segregation and condensation protein B